MQPESPIPFVAAVSTGLLQAQQLVWDEEVTPQPTLSEAMRGNQNAKQERNSGYNVTSVSQQKERGNSQEYLIRRLKRDAPDIAEALGRGEYPSARAAAKAAGIVKEKTRLEAITASARRKKRLG